MTTKRFAMEHAGQYFMYGGKKMKYVENEPNHVFTAKVQAKRVYYVQLKDLAL